MPATLIASELFGYEKGAFTGANARKHGHIEHAHRGTLFLDEIGDMPIDLQGLLLRFLQEGEILRVGGRQPIKVDVRVVAATNVRLREAIAAGRLREDLYYRLNVLTLHLPPLRERDGDVEVLATYFLRQIAQELGREFDGFAPSAMAAMLAYPWPGNVRELIATMRRAAVLANGPQVEVADLRLDQRDAARRRGRAHRGSSGPRAAIRPKPGSDGERDAILQALQDGRFNMTRAAQLWGSPAPPFTACWSATGSSSPALSGAAGRAGGGAVGAQRGGAGMNRLRPGLGDCLGHRRAGLTDAGRHRAAAVPAADPIGGHDNRLAVIRRNCLSRARCRIRG